MTSDIEKRVEALEQEMKQLTERIADTQSKSPRAKDWRRTVGAFAADPCYDDIVRLGREYRDRDRPGDVRESSDAGA